MCSFRKAQLQVLAAATPPEGGGSHATATTTLEQDLKTKLNLPVAGRGARDGAKIG